MIRGGSWSDYGKYLRSSKRWSFDLTEENYTVGIRPAYWPLP